MIALNMIHSYTFLHIDKTSRCNHTKAIGHNCFPQLLYTSFSAAYPCTVNTDLSWWMALRWLVGLDRCHVVMEKKSQRPFWPSARSLFLLLSANAGWWCRRHAVLIPVSQEHDIVAGPSNVEKNVLDFWFSLSLQFRLYHVEFLLGGTGQLYPTERYCSQLQENIE